ncbi:MAG: hypothetical protein MUF54_11415 [Polyangiaceae bacterium]|jgi:hypothetical protein|nr:hypothetical protein [Polyangiaceae bacterium]
MREGSRAAWLVGGVLLSASLAQQARAQEAPTAAAELPARQAIFARDAKSRELAVSFSYRDVVDQQVRHKLQSGLATVIVLAGGVFDAAGDDEPLPGTGVWQSCRVVFDVWNEVYRLHIARPGGESRSVAVNLEGVLRRCTEARRLPIQGQLTLGSSYFVAATVEVNPISQEMVERIRRWVSRPPGAAAASPGDSLFGSFVGLFVARIGKADRTLWFRTQSFVAPP